MDSTDEIIFNSSLDLFDDIEELHDADGDKNTRGSQPLSTADNSTSAIPSDCKPATSAITSDCKPLTYFTGSILPDNTNTLQACNSVSQVSYVEPKENGLSEYFQEGYYKEYLHSSPFNKIDGSSEEESLLGLPSKRHKICESDEEFVDDRDMVMEGSCDNISILNVSDNSLHNLSGDLPGQSTEDNVGTSAQRLISQTESSRLSEAVPIGGDINSVNDLSINTVPVVRETSVNSDNAFTDFDQLSFDTKSINNQEKSSINPNTEVEVISQKSPSVWSNVSELICPFCDIQLDNLWLMNSHIENLHSDTFNGEAAALNHTFLFVCPFCDLDLGDISALDLHLLAAHGEEQEPLQAGVTCPLCGVLCHSEDDLKLHIKTHATDETVYGVSEVDQEVVFPATSSHPLMRCPVCSLEMADGDLLASHVESHFNPHHRPGFDNELGSKQGAMQENIPVEKVPPKQKSSSNQSVPSTSQGNWKSSNGKGSISYKQQYEQNLERAVVGGKMTVTDFHEQKLLMAETECLGVDNGSTRTQGVIEKLEYLYRNQARPGQAAYLCSPVDHFAGSYGDKGWGCGYRNFQMMLSCLSRHPDYARKLFAGENISIPSIPKIQQMIELAWKKGFDPPGCRQLGGHLVNTSKWIGATEIVATLSSLGIRCHLADFHAPSSSDGTHPRLLEWVRSYFCRRQQEFLPPLYLQHQGHSRTVIGVEVERGTTKLLLFDPGTPSDQMASVARGQLTWKHMRIFRRTQSGFKSRQYQIVAVTGLLTDAEYQESKTLKSEQVS
ncbi:unnamed protein product [Candidula unifasciata]|uniref:Zinc finger-containing ubiquitin peptidase 1 n=1 Tax=Candidula unifasciata TaxID=100452 RepID=A0A8S4A286_9EUPU|nr:unnamed protein product [Candidula unifasciata]